MLLPRLEERLQAVLQRIRSEVHADIGSDHAHLPLHLLASGRVRRCVVVEKTAAPAAVARATLEAFGWLHAAEVRVADGLSGLHPGEVRSVSITGMGAKTVRDILEGRPERLDGVNRLVLQPNDEPSALRRWARERGWHLEDEALLAGYWAYPLLCFVRGEGEDPAYAGHDLELALRFGPQLLSRRDPLLRRTLEAHSGRLERVQVHGNPRTLRELAQVRAALALWD
nr:tRNA (adenine(22)-N(1))-methyltransferase TrmK [Deinobacterium chartae]